MNFFESMGQVSKAESDTHNADGTFKKGPANQQREMGDTAFEMAHKHLDAAKSSAKQGDQAAADFNLGMAGHYGQAGVCNHMMGGYDDATKKNGVPPLISQAVAKKAEEATAAIAALQKSWDERAK